MSSRYSLTSCYNDREVHKRTVQRVASLYESTFDGDCLNLLYITNNEFWEAAFESICPRNCMVISPNDGLFDNNFNVFKDILINSNGLIQLSRDKYTPQQLQKIKDFKVKHMIS